MVLFLFSLIASIRSFVEVLSQAGARVICVFVRPLALYRGHCCTWPLEVATVDQDFNRNFSLD